jgi:tRNA threonylcarbamoyladenosine biosynthesis protein TsaB
VIVLGFDTATASTAVALRLDDRSTLSARDDPPAGGHPGHATRLLELARGLLAEAGLGWSAVERVAVGVGPGTFTGLRVGVATARGLAQSLSAELVGVSTLKALALAALAAESTAQDARGGVLAVIDARRGEAFAAAYAGEASGVPVELTTPAALAPRELPGVIERAEEAAASEARWSWLAVGDGALRFHTQLESAGIPTAPERSPLHLVSATAICELGAHELPGGLHELVPDYRRRPDAELALRGTGTATGPSS